MPAGNMKLGFNRLFVVGTLVWVLYAGVVSPLIEQVERTNRDWDTSMLEQRVCSENAAKAYTDGMTNKEVYVRQTDACVEKGMKAWQERGRQNSFIKIYKAQWSCILLQSVTVPLIAYGAIRGIAAICLWVWHGYRQA